MKSFDVECAVQNGKSTRPYVDLKEKRLSLINCVAFIKANYMTETLFELGVYLTAVV